MPIKQSLMNYRLCHSGMQAMSSPVDLQFCKHIISECDYLISLTFGSGRDWVQHDFSESCAGDEPGPVHAHVLWRRQALEVQTIFNGEHAPHALSSQRVWHDNRCVAVRSNLPLVAELSRGCHRSTDAYGRRSSRRSPNAALFTTSPESVAIPSAVRNSVARTRFDIRASSGVPVVERPGGAAYRALCCRWISFAFICR